MLRSSGHGDVGKTSLASALLFDTGAVNRFGKVDQGNTSPILMKTKLKEK